jgi:ABC-type antimicrobial peptide transport system permease subunit
MISLTYVWNELRQRWGRTLVTALGLALGVGLVMGIVGVSNGLSNEQSQVLSPLSTVGTSIIVERTVGVADTSGSSTSTPTTPGSGFSSFFSGGSGTGVNTSDRDALNQNNSSVLTDLAKLGPPGTQFSNDFFVNGTLITFPQSAVSDVSKIKGVVVAVPALSLQALHETGTVPSVTDTVTTGGQTLTQTVTPPPVTAAQAQAVLQCLQASGVITVPPGASAAIAALPPTATFPTSTVTGLAGEALATFGTAFTNCLPPQFKQYVFNVIVPQQTITKVLNPPSTNTQTTDYTVAGVDPSNPSSGLITKAQLVKGGWFTKNPANEILVSSAYANTKGISVGQTWTIDKVGYKVVGLVNPTLTGDTSDIYFDLPTLQSSSSQPGRIDEILVKVANSSDVTAVATTIKKELPGATVLTSKQLAGQVNGSLSDAKKLAGDLGVALGVIILIAALLIAALLTLSSVAKRVREIGTLRAIGWSRGRVVNQILAEMFGIGVLGAVIGVGVGLGICALVDAVGPTLSYTVSGATVGASSASSLAHIATAATRTSTVRVQTSISVVSVIGAVVIALLGALLAGLAGAWRAARLSPTDALRDLG